MKQFVGIGIIDKSLSHHCTLTNTCNVDLRVLTRENGIALGNCPNELRQHFYEEYVDDVIFNDIDAILCLHATSMCELYMPFNKPMIVIASTRFDIGRYDHNNKDALSLWIKNIKLIASKSHNVIAANNMYDVQYIKYFTGISNVMLLPSIASYLDSEPSSGVGSNIVYKSYKPIHMESRGVHTTIVELLQNRIINYNNIHTSGSGSSSPIEARLVRDVYEVYTFEQLASHIGIVIIPYQVSLMSFFEYYRLGIPLFVPSARLLTKWHMKYNILNERTWDLVNEMHIKQCSSIIPRSSSHSNTTRTDTTGTTTTNTDTIGTESNLFQYDPNDECSQDAMYHWIKLSDYYQFPHIIQFNSLTELVRLLSMYKNMHISEVKNGNENGLNIANSRGSANQNVNIGNMYDMSSRDTLSTISMNMLQYINKLDIQVSNSWYSILTTIKTYNSKKKDRFPSMNEALSSLYGVELDLEQCYGMSMVPNA